MILTATAKQAADAHAARARAGAAGRGARPSGLPACATPAWQSARMPSDAAPVQIEEVAAGSPEILEAVGRLVRQLSASAPTPGAAQLDALLAADATRLLIARDTDRRIVGMLTLALFPIPTGVRAWIEDVVVDRDARGRGIGERLTLAALALAAADGARTVDLTSRPGRAEANRLYSRLGFQLRETNVYRRDAGPAA
jgi:ribosomal protein S18 acetylase RimI-like enzyme